MLQFAFFCIICIKRKEWVLYSFFAFDATSHRCNVAIWCKRKRTRKCWRWCEWTFTDPRGALGYTPPISQILGSYPPGLAPPLKCWIRHYWRNPQKINKHHTKKRVCLIRDWLEIDELEKDPVICRSEIWSPLHTVTRPRALQERPARLKRHRNRGIYKIENNLVFFLVYCKYSHEVYSPTARGHGLSHRNTKIFRSREDWFAQPGL